MSNILSIEDFLKKVNDKMSLEEWQGFAQAQNNLLERLHREVQRLEDKNKHLEKLLVTKSNGLVMQLTPEETICIQQISFIEEQSMKRALTLEEVKRLDLLVKNLKLIREESTIVVNRPADHLKEDDLVAIISRSNSTDNS